MVRLFPIVQSDTNPELLLVAGLIALLLVAGSFVTSSFVTSLVTFRTVTGSGSVSLATSLGRVTNLFCLCSTARITGRRICISSFFVTTRS